MDRQKKVVFVNCQFRAGSFPHERAFVIRFPDGSEYRGMVPSSFCFSRDGSPLGELSLSADEVDGKLIGLLFTVDENGISKVELPDGEVYLLEKGQYEVVTRMEMNQRVSL